MKLTNEGPVLGKFFDEIEDLSSTRMKNVLEEYKNDVIKKVSLFSQSYDQTGKTRDSSQENYLVNGKMLK